MALEYRARGNPKDKLVFNLYNPLEDGLQMEALLLEGLTASEAIREYLVTLGEGYPYGFWKIWRLSKKKTSYQAVARLFWILHTIGLIESVRFEAGKAPIKKHFYRITPGLETDERWIRPQSTLYPDTALGRKYYEMLEKGLKPKGGRRKEYM